MGYVSDVYNFFSVSFKKIIFLIYLTYFIFIEKHGLLPNEAFKIFTHVSENCKNLTVKGT